MPEDNGVADILEVDKTPLLVTVVSVPLSANVDISKVLPALTTFSNVLTTKLPEAVLVPDVLLNRKVAYVPAIIVCAPFVAL
jgi:hypothetical protein